MLTKGNWLILKIRTKGFRLWLPIPLFIIIELVWQAMELMEFIGGLGVRKVKEFREVSDAMPMIMEALTSLGEGGRYDLVDIDAGEKNGDNVRILIRIW